MLKEQWEIGETAYFEYHCFESPESSDAAVWYRSHTLVTIIGGPEGEDYALEVTREQRAEDGVPLTYRVRWPDGFEYDVWEDELSTSAADWYRPAPPKVTVT